VLLSCLLVNLLQVQLVMSNIKHFKYDWIWEKATTTGFQHAKYRPMQRHENILVFCKTTPSYNPIKTLQKERTGNIYSKSESSPIKYDNGKTKIYKDKYPQSIQVYILHKVERTISAPNTKARCLIRISNKDLF
jgi:hypothetical protein